MRLSVVTFGSEGDTRPLAALCRGLLNHGHEVKLFAEQSTLTLPRQLGVPCEALAGDIKSTLPIADPRQEIRVTDVLNTVRAVNAVIATNTASWLRTVAEHASEADAIAFSSLAVGVGLALRQELRKPAIGLFFQPISPTAEFSSPMAPPMRLPGWLNRLSFRPAHRHMWSNCGRHAQAARSEIFGTHAKQRLHLDGPMLYGVSSQLVSRPRDWPADHVVCGHWSLPAINWQPSPALLDFLAAGEPPIYAGFGSPSGFIRAKALRALIDAVAGRRALFGAGWSQIDVSVLPANFHVVRDVPHEWLLPQVSVAIHHGGAGTTHTAARAGVPQIILPIGGDHHFWASRVAMRGIAPPYTRGARLNARAIAAMIEFSQRDATRHNARALSEAMGSEDGVGNAIRTMEELTRIRPGAA